jgi:hypothetical protein
LPPHAKDQEAVPSILVRNSLTIGYGPGGWAPARFELPKLPKNRIADVDIGYLKLFISTKYVDHSHMMQATPFGHFRGLVMVAERPPEMWDTVKFAVVLRKQAGSI